MLYSKFVTACTGRVLALPVEGHSKIVCGLMINRNKNYRQLDLVRFTNRQMLSSFVISFFLMCKADRYKRRR